MKIVKARHEYMPPTDSDLKFIEKIGRTCYKSEDKITDDSAGKFVENLIKRGHWAMLEHGTIYILVDKRLGDAIWNEASDHKFDMRYVVMTPATLEKRLISGNFRAFDQWFSNYVRLTAPGTGDEDLCLPCVQALLESIMAAYQSLYAGRYSVASVARSSIQVVDEKDLESIKMMDLYRRKHIRHTVKFTCDRGVSHELVRHRPCSFAQESSRYANYSKEKFGSEITVIKPFFFEEGSHGYDVWKRSCEHAERAYMTLLEQGYSPQEARSVLPNSLKTELIMTATEEEWQHIIDLRYHGTTGAPHPQMQELMGPWVEELTKITNGRVS